MIHGLVLAWHSLSGMLLPEALASHQSPKTTIKRLQRSNACLSPGEVVGFYRFWGKSGAQAGMSLGRGDVRYINVKVSVCMVSSSGSVVVTNNTGPST